MARLQRRARQTKIASPRNDRGDTPEITDINKINKKARQDTQFESEGAEFLVLGQLLIRKIPAYKAYTNLRGYDVVATSPNGNKSAKVQVKSRWASDANSFLINKTISSDFVVLVRLNLGNVYRANKGGGRAPPEYYILRAKDAQNLVVEGKRMSKIPWTKKTRPTIERYKDRWDLIETSLKPRAPAKPTKAE